MRPLIALPYAKRPSFKWPKLAFAQHPVTHYQRRLRGRTVLEPVLHLDRFRCQAVIDQAILRFTISRPTQSVYLREKLMDLADVKISAIHPVGSSPYSLKRFDVTIQEPTAATLLWIEEYLLTRFGLSAVPELRLLEVSLDFWPDRASEEEKARLIGVLQRCYLPQQDIWSNRARPRFHAGDTIGGRRFILPKTDGRHLSSEMLKVPPVDATYYLGERDSDWMTRLMHKELDDQNPTTGARRVLGPDEQRVRMEVVLRGEALSKYGLRQPRDLIGFKFTRLQGDHFRFLLPTFRTPEHPYWETLLGAMETWKDNNQRVEIFLKAGLIGLEAERRARSVLLDQNRQQIRSARKRLGVSSRPSRQGSGLQAHYVAYEEMNRMIQRALEGLQRREATELTRR